MTAIPDGTGSGWRAMAYDAEGRLTELCDWICSTGSTRLFFTYDGDGRRTRIVTAGGGTSTTTEFRYLGTAISEEWVDNTLTRRYVTDPDGVVVKMVIPAGQTHAGTYLVNWNGHGDALNLVRVLGDGSLEVANSYTYGTWGEPTTHTHGSYGNLGFRFLYVGREGVQWDAAAELYLMGWRHYSPRLGRFLQPDPVADEENPYAYAGSGPVSATDADGRKFIRLFGQAGGGGNVPAIRIGRITLIKPTPRYNPGPRRPYPPPYSPPPIRTEFKPIPPNLRGGGPGNGFPGASWLCRPILRRAGCVALGLVIVKAVYDSSNRRHRP
jgi:RHS repeat-associated protein